MYMKQNIVIWQKKKKYDVNYIPSMHFMNINIKTSLHYYQ